MALWKRKYPILFQLCQGQSSIIPAVNSLLTSKGCIYRCFNTQNYIKNQNLSLGFILKIFLKFRKFQPRYSYKIYSYKKECSMKQSIRLTRATLYFKFMAFRDLTFVRAGATPQRMFEKRKSTVAQKGHTCKLKMLLQTKNLTCKLKMLLQIKNSTCKLKIVHAN